MVKSKIGEVPEWLNGAVSKTVVGVTPPRVQIPASPPVLQILSRRKTQLRVFFTWVILYLNYVLRHNSAKLRDRYVAPLSIEEVMDKQEIMEEDLFDRR